MIGGGSDGGTSESASVRWKRRAVTIPTMLGATAAAVLFSPAIVAGAVIYDVGRFRFRLPTLRLFLFVAQYVVNDSAEILLAGPYWLAAGFGTHLHSLASIRRHERLQRWSIDVMARRADQLLGLTVDVDAEGAAALEEPGPVIVPVSYTHLCEDQYPMFGKRSSSIPPTEARNSPTQERSVRTCGPSGGGGPGSSPDPGNARSRHPWPASKMRRSGSPP